MEFNKAIVTGGSGVIGGHIVDYLVSIGKDVIVIDNESAQGNEVFYKNAGAVYYNRDISSYEDISPLFNSIDVVFHLAAESRIQPSILNPIQTTRTNIIGTCNVLQASREHNIDRLIYSSTSACYGLINTPPLVEDMPKDHLNPYSLTKCAGEDLCVMYTKLFKLKTISLRYFNVYGARAPTVGQYSPVVGLLLKQSKEGQPMTIVGDGLQERDFVHISDVISANILAATTSNEEAFGQVFNVGTGSSVSILSLANFIGTGHCFIDSRVGEARNTLADSTKAKTILGWVPTKNIFEYLSDEINKGQDTDVPGENND